MKIMRATNYYVEDLNLNSIGSVSTIDVDTQNPNVEFKINVERTAENGYTMTGFSGFSKEVIEMLQGRYLGEEFDKDTFNIRVRDAQYEVRKEAKKSKWSDVDTKAPTVTVAVATETPATPKPATPTKPRGGLEEQIFNLVLEGIRTNETEKFIKELVERKINESKPETREVELKFPDATVKNVGKQHKDFETVLLTLKADVNLALVGPAGSGKTTTVSKAADALGLPFYTKSVSAQTGVHEFFGYQDAHGNYVRTLFREAYEFGGVFLLDEFDAGNPNVLAALNQAVGNPSCAFADGMIAKHEDFLVVAAGNTYGNGATAEYVGRNKIDGATLDRFAFLQFDYDEKFEMDLAPNKEWAEKVQEIRRKVAQKKIRAIVSPRATFNGAKLMNAGIPEKKVLEMVIYKDLSKDEIEMIRA